MYGGRIRLMNRARSPSSSTRRSFTRGARTCIVPAPQVNRSRLRTAVADYQPPAVPVARIGVHLDVVCNLFLQRGGQHPSRALSGQRIQGRHGALGRTAFGRGNCSVRQPPDEVHDGCIQAPGRRFRRPINVD